MTHPNTRIRIDHGTWINSKGQDHQGTLFIEGDRIVAIDQEPEAFEADETVNAEGLRLFPGFIDSFTYLPSQRGQDINLASETKAAAKAGFTTLMCSPAHTPVLDASAQLTRLMDEVESLGFVSLKPFGTMTQGLKGEALANMHGLHSSGCVALSQGFEPFANRLVMRRAFEYAATFDFLFVSQPWDSALAGNGCAHEGALSGKMGLDGLANSVETVAIAEQLILAEETGLRIHFTGISSAKSLAMIQQAKAEGMAVSADTTMAHLLFNESAIEGFDSVFHIRPPLRRASDQAAFLEAVKQGELMISTHHLACDSADKAAPFASAKAGMSQYDCFPAALVSLNQQGISWQNLQQALVTGPTKVFGLAAHTIAIGQKADLCFIDPTARWQLTEKSAASKGSNYPWWGKTLIGKNTRTLRNGRWVYI